ncbi:MAG: YiiX/YebB-like N1pC/P60 family cysteine hydrolase [Thiotrichales bacterium]
MASFISDLKLGIGRMLARYLTSPIQSYKPFATYPTQVLEESMQKADVLLVDGNSRISTAIKYLTQSTWSHSALFVGETGLLSSAGEPCVLIEAELGKGVIASPLSKYSKFNTRICRAIDLTEPDREKVCAYAIGQLGKKYDLKHIIDLARYLFPTPPVPVRFRRRLIALGSGDPSRSICSTLIAQAFQNIQYPILPRITRPKRVSSLYYNEREIMHIRHVSLFAPRDFDISPFFQIVKPTIEEGFDYKRIIWSHDSTAAPEPDLDQGLLTRE